LKENGKNKGYFVLFNFILWIDLKARSSFVRILLLIGLPTYIITEIITWRSGNNRALVETTNFGEKFFDNFN